MSFLIFCNGMFVNKSRRVPPFTFFGTMRLLLKEKIFQKFQFFSKKSVLRFLSLRYGADFRRSRLVIVYSVIILLLTFWFTIISLHFHFTLYQFTPYHFTPHSFHCTLISPHVHFIPHFNYSNASHMNYYSNTISILVLKEKRTESNFQLDHQTICQPRKRKPTLSLMFFSCPFWLFWYCEFETLFKRIFHTLKCIFF